MSSLTDDSFQMAEDRGHFGNQYGYVTGLSAHTGSSTKTVVIFTPGSKGISVASISSAPIFKDPSSAFWVFSCALTPGKSINQPIHQSPDCFITALNFICITSQMECPNPCKSCERVHQPPPCAEALQTSEGPSEICCGVCLPSVKMHYALSDA